MKTMIHEKIKTIIVLTAVAAVESVFMCQRIWASFYVPGKGTELLIFREWEIAEKTDCQA